ncbi:hypothetical protein ZWY2020_059950 [Hordeum vulgare]|nr:hypothetical protein ZWY2020_059950 [Hordeum vulgare]
MDSGAGATAICMPYRHIRDAEMELVRINSAAQEEAGQSEQAKRAKSGRASLHGRPSSGQFAAALPPHPIHPANSTHFSAVILAWPHLCGINCPGRYPRWQILDVSEQILRLEEFEAKLHGDDRAGFAPIQM